jgi:hypothetical protein
MSDTDQILGAAANLLDQMWARPPKPSMRPKGHTQVVEGKLPRQDSNLRPGDEKTVPTKADPKPGGHLANRKSAGKRRTPPETGPSNRPQTVPEEKRGV